MATTSQPFQAFSNLCHLLSSHTGAYPGETSGRDMTAPVGTGRVKGPSPGHNQGAAQGLQADMGIFKDIQGMLN